VAPLHIEALMGEVEALVRQYPVGDPQLIEHWRPLRERIRREFKDALEDPHAGKLGAVLGTQLIAQENEHCVSDAQQGDGPSSPSTDVKRTVEHGDCGTERHVDDPEEPFQREMHGPSVGRLGGTVGVSRNNSDEKTSRGDIRWWWVILAMLTTWLGFGGLNLANSSTRLTVSLIFVGLGVIAVALALMPELRSVAAKLSIAGGIVGGLGGIMSISKGVEAPDLGTFIRGAVILGVLATVLALLIVLVVKRIGRKLTSS